MSTVEFLNKLDKLSADISNFIKQVDPEEYDDYYYSSEVIKEKLSEVEDFNSDAFKFINLLENYIKELYLSKDETERANNLIAGINDVYNTLSICNKLENILNDGGAVRLGDESFEEFFESNPNLKSEKRKYYQIDLESKSVVCFETGYGDIDGYYCEGFTFDNYKDAKKWLIDGKSIEEIIEEKKQYYEVEIVATLIKKVQVKADSREEADDIAQAVYKNKGMNFTTEDHVKTEFNISEAGERDEGLELLEKKVPEFQRVIKAINEFCFNEYEDESADFNDLTKIPLAYTTIGEDNEIEVNVYADLVNKSINTYLNGDEVSVDKYKYYEDMAIDIESMDFDTMVSVRTEDYERWEYKQQTLGADLTAILEPNSIFDQDDEEISIEPF